MEPSGSVERTYLRAEAEVDKDLLPRKKIWHVYPSRGISLAVVAIFNLIPVCAAQAPPPSLSSQSINSTLKDPSCLPKFLAIYPCLETPINLEKCCPNAKIAVFSFCFCDPAAFTEAAKFGLNETWARSVWENQCGFPRGTWLSYGNPSCPAELGTTGAPTTFLPTPSVGPATLVGSATQQPSQASPLPAPSASTGGQEEKGKSSSTAWIIIAVVAVATTLCGVALVAVIMVGRKRRGAALKRENSITKLPTTADPAKADPAKDNLPPGRRKGGPFHDPPAVEEEEKDLSLDIPQDISGWPFRGKNEGPPDFHPAPKRSPVGSSVRQFSLQELRVATGNFSKAGLLGEGRFGGVHRGVLSSGQVVAVKRFRLEKMGGTLTSWGVDAEREFRAEAEVITRVHHRHLLQMIGYCATPNERLLVLEYMKHGSLGLNLHGKRGLVLDWPTRLRIAIGAAKGLSYLHHDCQPRIIHRDVKASNILLDENFEAKVADFGFAKLGRRTTDRQDGDYASQVVGTPGYLPIECVLYGMKNSERTDVFSFGVVLLEVVSGRTPLNPSAAEAKHTLVHWAQSWRGEDIYEVIDPRLGLNYVEHEVRIVWNTALRCVSDDDTQRPTMGEVLQMLQHKQEPTSRPSSRSREEEGDMKSGAWGGAGPGVVFFQKHHHERRNSKGSREGGSDVRRSSEERSGGSNGSGGTSTRQRELAIWGGDVRTANDMSIGTEVYKPGPSVGEGYKSAVSVQVDDGNGNPWDESVRYDPTVRDHSFYDILSDPDIESQGRGFGL